MPCRETAPPSRGARQIAVLARVVWSGWLTAQLGIGRNRQVNRRCIGCPSKFRRVVKLRIALGETLHCYPGKSPQPAVIFRCTARNALFRLNLFPQGSWHVGYRIEARKGNRKERKKRKRRLQGHRLKSVALAVHARDLRFLRCLRFPLLLADPARYRRPETTARSLLWFGCGRSHALGRTVYLIGSEQPGEINNCIYAPIASAAISAAAFAAGDPIACTAASVAAASSTSSLRNMAIFGRSTTSGRPSR